MSMICSYSTIVGVQLNRMDLSEQVSASREPQNEAEKSLEGMKKRRKNCEASINLYICIQFQDTKENENDLCIQVYVLKRKSVIGSIQISMDGQKIRGRVQ